jgi:beta-lactamase class A
MRNQGSISSLRWISIAFLIGSVILVTMQLVKFSRERAIFPPGMVIAGVPVGGLDRQGSAQRLLEVYTQPVEIRYGGAVIHLSPTVVGFQLDLESMLAAADLGRSQQSFWEDFWNYLWGQTAPSAEIPLKSSFSETRLRNFLIEEIATRYDKPATPSIPSPGTVNFRPGLEGTALDVERSIQQIESALKSPDRRIADLMLVRTQPPRPSFRNLEILLKQIIYEIAEFDGLVGFYLLDLQTAQEIHFAHRQGQDLPVEPDIAFTASSIIKVPIMVSVYRRIGEEADPETLRLIRGMIEESGNDPADWVMERVLDRFRAPLIVTEDMRELGLKNTFLAGHFQLGAPLLATFQTPANQRTDVSTNPDIYNQTTVSDIGMLLEDIYLCSQSGGGSLVAIFEGEITQRECQAMIQHMVNNRLPDLITKGVPEGARIAHKHGWVSSFGVIKSIGDAGIVFTPGGNYVLVIFLHHPDQLIWDNASNLIADLSRAVYNYFNLPGQY